MNDEIKYKVVKPFTAFLDGKKEVIDVVETKYKEQTLNNLTDVFKSVFTEDFEQDDACTKTKENQKIIEIAFGSGFMKIKK